MAGISFINYVVDAMYYKTNPHFDAENNKEIFINEEIFADIDIDNEKNVAIVTLKAELVETNEVPFSFEASIVGYFEFNLEESDGNSFKDFLETNAIAILFPYLRSIVSELTGKSNRFPSYNMPVRNIAHELSSKGNISIKEN
ncbi:protein-export chaperone SecB [Staphylococcus intermedius]|uniref:Preprotein translocase subunit SecB n=1 Tax=Staphylococcus intermedius NCTC 11048 TaxID=1141106 RepID=A0A380G8H6_STAIN|nr:protein-export chaperone SecB [Staphylococcus intermedius]PCF65429.1 pretranslocase subunit SecB family protein [Staphylococcus intermedius]PCF81107.1 pretranslocase subunit SecB family protein [Staphylococcus intermedius]PCF82389.1 pretranslocase subunit SecB family protein [Staphylococcus intermedius]PCF87090.1 pretranslocase subunit SecB family protein [Staphylococcus intermedius]PCF87648.1 pretranslocase subunit SecB family protein [Staphylococcus intermedius]